MKYEWEEVKTDFFWRTRGKKLRVEFELLAGIKKTEIKENYDDYMKMIIKIRNMDLIGIWEEKCEFYRDFCEERKGQ